MHTATVTRDATGLPTGLKSVVPVSLVGGMIAKVTQIASSDDVVVPNGLLEKVAVEAVGPVIGATIQRKLDTGAWGVPFIRTA